MSFKLIDNHLSPAEGEVMVRSYHCTKLSPAFALIGLKTDGYLTVTNKRIVYFAEGSSVYGFAGNSKLYNEVPIADVANLSLRKGTRFSFLRLICGLLFGQIPAAIVTLILSGVMLVLERAGGGSNPYMLRFGVFLQLSVAILLVFRSLSVSRENIVRLMLAASGLSLVLSVPALALAHGMGLQLLPSIYQSGLTILSIPLGCYWLWCLYWFVRREYLTMAIRSKTNWPPSIQIAGVSWWGRINVAADLAYGMAPAVDADAMFKELGAMVTDIQTLGDHGIKKWNQNAAEVNAEREIVADKWAAQKSLMLRYAFGFILLFAIVITAESSIYAYNQHQEELRQTAIKIKDRLDDAKHNASLDQFARDIASQMVTKAEQEQSAGVTAFKDAEFTQASEHWKVAAVLYSQIPDVVKPFRDAEELRSQYTTHLQELISIAFHMEEKSGEPSSDDLARLNSYLEIHTPEEWILVKDAVSKAEAFKTAKQGTDCWNQWRQISNLTPAITTKVRTGVLLDQAEALVKTEQWNDAMVYINKALTEDANSERAKLLRERVEKKLNAPNSP